MRSPDARASKIANFALFQVGWFACVLGAAHEMSYVGPVYVVLWVAAWTAMTGRVRAEILTAVGAVAVGYACDTLLVRGERLRLFGTSDWVTPSRPWMLALWLNFAPTLRSSLGWLHGRWLLAALLGAAGGPLAYLSAESLGAVEITGDRGASLLWVAGAWLVSMPALLVVSRFAGRRASPARSSR